MRFLSPHWPAAAAVACVLLSPLAHAGIFDDSEARKAILDLRQKLEQSNEQQRARQAELNAQMAELQRAVKDQQQGVDDRMRRLEPQKVTVDGREFTADPDEKRLYDEAMAVFRRGEFNESAAALAAFQKRYPSSGYNESVLFWLGNAYYGKRDYKNAIASFRTLVSTRPDGARAPEALLSIANCQVELKDPKAARRTIDELIKTYPKSEAAQAGRERLASLK